MNEQLKITIIDALKTYLNKPFYERDDEGLYSDSEIQKLIDEISIDEVIIQRRGEI